MPKLSNEQVEGLRRDYAAHDKGKVIAHRFGVNRSTVVRRVTDLAQVERAERDQKIADLYAKGHNAYQIAKAVGMTRRGVTLVIKRLGLKQPKVVLKKIAFRKQIMTLLADGRELTPDEMADLLDADVYAIRPRITDLAREKKIVKTGERRRTPGGNGATAAVWRKA
jgi:hypothetical protein